MDAILEVQSVSKEYTKGKKALDDVSLTVNKGEFISIIGKSGAGKSTLLRCINRLIDPTEGKIIFDGKDMSEFNAKQLREARREIGMIFQHYNLVDRLTVLENTLHGRLGYTSTIKGMVGMFTKEERESAIDVLKMLGLEEEIDKRCDQLSGGQKQRVGIARALVQDPKIILCDEPIASLDPSSSKVIMEYLKQINEKMGITVLVNLHQVDVAMSYGKRIVGVQAGKLVYDGDASNLSQDMIHQIYGTKVGDLITDVA